MRFPLAAAILLLSTAVVATPALALPTCTATESLDVPLHVGLGPGFYNYTGTSNTTFYLYGNQVGLAIAVGDALLCTYFDCGPSTATCTVPAGSYTLQIYPRGTGSSPWALVTLECVATPATSCA